MDKPSKEGRPTLRECGDFIKRASIHCDYAGDYTCLFCHEDEGEKHHADCELKLFIDRLTPGVLELDEEIHGNSPEYWYAKATAYKGIVFQVCEAFRKLGYKGEFGDLDTLAERLSAYTEVLNKRRTALEELYKDAKVGNVHQKHCALHAMSAPMAKEAGKPYKCDCVISVLDALTPTQEDKE